MATGSTPSPYPPVSFHSIRALSFISSIIVSGIVGWFWYQLRHDDFKIPWTFLLILAASGLTGVSLILTTVIYTCACLSPLFNLVLNVPLSIFWITGFSLLTWNTVGALSHSCSTSNWGDSDGVMICRRYKASYSFIVLGVLSSVAMIIVDVRARVKQNTLRRYVAMDDSKLRLVEEQQGDYPNWPTAYSRQTSRGYHDNDGEVPYGVDPDGRQPQDDSRQHNSGQILGTAQGERESSPYAKARSRGGSGGGSSKSLPPPTMAPNMSLHSVLAVLILSIDTPADSSRLFAKYYAAPHTNPQHPLPPQSYSTLKEQKVFEKGLLEKTAKQTSDVILYDNKVVVFKAESDVMLYVVGSADENEILLYNVVLALRDTLSILLKNSTDKRTIIENYDLVTLAIDEIVDDGIVLETDPVMVATRVSKAPAQDAPNMKNIDLSEQGIQNLWEFGKKQGIEFVRRNL
ncbi:hypothetical protein DV737_g2201, partial [Chaetothyriales sp. CBS 132003]